MPSEVELYYRELSRRPARLPLTTYQAIHVDLEDAPPNDDYKGGARITAVEPNSQAALGGLKVGDIILTLTDERYWRLQIKNRFDLKLLTNTEADHLKPSSETEVMLGILRPEGCVYIFVRLEDEHPNNHGCTP